MAAHKWWRLWMPQSVAGPSSGIWLQEVKFCGANREDFSTGGVATASSEYSSSYAAANAFDKVISGTSPSGWSTVLGQFPAWLAYEHPSAVDVKAVEIWLQTSSGSNANQHPVWSDIKLQYSDNGSTWVDEPGFKYFGTSGINGQGVLINPASIRVELKKEGVYQVQGYNLEPQSPRCRWAKGGYWLWETQTTGSGTISGIVTIENIPGSRKVRLYRKHDGMLLREMWSAANGAYSFSNLDPNWEYFVVAHDHLRVHNAVVSDMIDLP